MPIPLCSNREHFVQIGASAVETFHGAGLRAAAIRFATSRFGRPAPLQVKCIIDGMPCVEGVSGARLTAEACPNKSRRQALHANRILHRHRALPHRNSLFRRGHRSWLGAHPLLHGRDVLILRLPRLDPSLHSSLRPRHDALQDDPVLRAPLSSPPSSPSSSGSSSRPSISTTAARSSP